MSLRCPACAFPLTLPLPALCPACGSFTDRLELTRTAKGKVTLKQQWRIAFYPLETKTLNWRECEEIRILHAESGCLEWVMFFGLLGTTLIGGLLWYWFVIRPGHVKAAMC